MSTSMSSGPIITHEPGRCQKKRFLNPWVWARESKLPVSAFDNLSHHSARWRDRLTYSALGGRAARKRRKNPSAKPARAASGNGSQGWKPRFCTDQVFPAAAPAEISPPTIAMMNRRRFRIRSKSMESNVVYLRLRGMTGPSAKNATTRSWRRYLPPC